MRFKSVRLRRSSSGNRRSSNDSNRSSQPSQIDSSVLLVLWLKFSRMRDGSRPQSSPKRKARSRGICYWNGQVYKEGQTICSNHNLIRAKWAPGSPLIRVSFGWRFGTIPRLGITVRDLAVFANWQRGFFLSVALSDLPSAAVHRPFLRRKHHGNFPLDSSVLTVITFRNSSNVDWGFLVQQMNR